MNQAPPSTLHPDDPSKPHTQLTAKQYAALQLRVPKSGTDWLDAMICDALFIDLTASALAGVAANPNGAC
ncbi:hypothetical protein, partial [Citrobacter braakii]|uniref:hypothetical protein n=1 Tax=Citrobacter braakii TaxID=57706 RepID=UPI00197DA36E